MRLTLNRFTSSNNDSLSMLCINAKFEAFVIEDEYREVKVKGETRIPAGVYKLVLVDSPKFTPIYKHKMIMLLDVPGFSGILIHPGVKEKDTDGCLLPGNVARYNPMGESRLEESKAAYFRIYPTIAHAIETEGAEIEVIDSDLP